MRDKLNALPDDELIHAAIEYIAEKVGDDEERRLAVLNALPEGLRAFFAVWLVDAELKNGGFDQYFWNNGDNAATAAVGGFRFFGFEEHAALMEEALAIRQRQRASIASFEEEGTLEAFSEATQQSALGSLDMAYYDLPDIEAILIRFIREHPELFAD